MNPTLGVLKTILCAMSAWACSKVCAFEVVHGVRCGDCASVGGITKLLWI